VGDGIEGGTLKILIALMLCGGVFPAVADTIISQPFIEDGAGLFDNIQAFALFAGGSFPDTGGMFGFDDPSWGDVNIDPYWSEASGLAVDSLRFNLNFQYDGVTSSTTDFYMFSDGTIVDSAYADFDGGGSLVLVIDPIPDAAAQYLLDAAAAVAASTPATPEPGTAILGVLGLSMLAVFRQRRTRRRC
jgi:hypothetical protein